MNKLTNQCPQCYAWYGPTAKFCAYDGAELTTDWTPIPWLVRQLDQTTSVLCRVERKQPRGSLRAWLCNYLLGANVRLTRRFDRWAYASSDKDWVPGTHGQTTVLCGGGETGRLNCPDGLTMPLS